MSEPVAAPRGVLHQQGVPTGAEPFNWQAVTAVPHTFELPLKENAEAGWFSKLEEMSLLDEAHCWEFWTPTHAR